MSELSPEAKALLSAARQESAPAEADRARVRQALAVALGPAGTGAGRSSTGSSAPIAGTRSTAVKAVLAIALAGAGIGGLTLWRGAESDRAVPVPPSVRPLSGPPPVAAVAEPVHEIAPPGPAAVPEGTTTLPSHRPASAPAAHASHPRSPTFAPLDLGAERSQPAAAVPPDPPEGTLGRELKLLRRAQVELRDGRPALALELLDEHARLFPDGALRQERIAARIQALRALGRKDEAAEAERGDR